MHTTIALPHQCYSVRLASLDFSQKNDKHETFSPDWWNGNQLTTAHQGRIHLPYKDSKFIISKKVDLR